MTMMSQGKKFKEAVATEQPLQVVGAINAYHAVWRNKQVTKRYTYLAAA